MILLRGGGVVNYGGTLTLTNSTISGIRLVAAAAGKIATVAPSPITNSTISGNSAPVQWQAAM